MPLSVRRHVDHLILSAFETAVPLEAVRCTVGGQGVTGDAHRDKGLAPNAIIAETFTWEQSGAKVSVSRTSDPSVDQIQLVINRPALTPAEQNLQPHNQNRKSAQERVDRQQQEFDKARPVGEQLYRTLASTLGAPMPTDNSVPATLQQVVSGFQQQIEILHKTATDLQGQYLAAVAEANTKSLAEAEQRREQLQEEYAQKDARRTEELLAREEQLRQRIADLDTHEAKFARRQRRHDLLRQLFSDDPPIKVAEPPASDHPLEQGEQSKAEATSRPAEPSALSGAAALRDRLTKQGRRIVITSLSLMTLILVAEFALFYYYSEAPSSWPVWSARAALGIGFATTTTYLLRWLDIRYRREEEEQLYRRRLSFDVSRAEWLVETLLEYGSEVQSPMPQEVTNALTRGLFDGVTGARGAHIADEVTKALRGKIKVSNGDQTVEVDRT